MNTYQTNLNLDVIRDLCRERGAQTAFRKGEPLVRRGEVCDKIGFIESGYFHYRASNRQGREFITGFAFQDELVADYPRCLYGEPSDIDIVSATSSKVYLIEATLIANHFSQNIDTERLRRMISDRIFLQTYAQLHDLYTKTAEERYRDLLRRSPQITQRISLRELASFLRVTPTTISTIRHRITFNEP